MRKLILILMLCGVAGFLAANSYIDFYVQTTGDNMNSGHTTSDTATYSATAGDFTNNTSASVCTWHKTGEDLSGVTNNAWASIYPDGATTNVYVGMVTAVDDTADTITVSLNAKAGTVPASSTAATSIKVGGAWKGPGLYSLDTNANFFPFNFAANSMTNTPTNIVCINFKNGVTYDCTNSMYHSLSGPMMFAGYTTTPRDGGKTTFNGNAAAVAGFVLFNHTGNDNYFKDFIFDGNGNSGAVNGVTAAGGENVWEGCVFANMRQSGVNISGFACEFLMCEAYSNNIAATASHGGITDANGTDLFYRCYAHHNFGVSGHGMMIKDESLALNCICSHNAGWGMQNNSSVAGFIVNCSFYSNSVTGFRTSGSGPSLACIHNCSFFNNAQYGIDNSSAQMRIMNIENCAFGSGTQTNVLGNISKAVLATDPRMLAVISGTLTYTANETPWVDPDNGNFTEKSTALTKARGSGVFQQKFVNSPTNTVSYPDIGAAQYASTNAASGGEHSHVFAQ